MNFAVTNNSPAHRAPLSIGDYGGPNLMGCRGMGTEIGAGVSKTRTDPILYQSRFKLIYRKLVCAIKPLGGTERTTIGKRAPRQSSLRSGPVATFAAVPRGERLMSDWRTTGKLFHTVGDNRSQLHDLLA
jgi:hypothetical protein